MYFKQCVGFLLIHKAAEISARVEYDSKLWEIWRTNLTPTTCLHCASMNGRIFSVVERIGDTIPVHPNCRCYVEALKAIAVGTATNAGVNGVDLYLALHGRLPDYYISEADAQEQGWQKWLGNLADILPGKVIGGDIFENRKHKLPESSGRIWYEADLDYDGGYRNNCRLLFSNDGLLFVTYDHYMTFYEIGLENVV